jgi:DNA-binding MarR family transcriptional regulator
MGDDPKTPGGLNGLANLDRVVHEPARLMILMYLYAAEEADFVFLLNATELTWGNLSSHVGKLEEAGYVEVEKGFLGKKPRTLARLTPEGRQAFEDYRRTMRAALGPASEISK